MQFLGHDKVLKAQLWKVIDTRIGIQNIQYLKPNNNE